jgi:hypothetical protein
MMDFRLGLYQHFKGGYYSAIMLATNSETEAPMVVYVSLADGTVWVRPLEMFTEEVVWPDEVRRPRFMRVEG